LIGYYERKRPVGKLRNRWEDNIKVYLQEIGLESEDWIDLAEDGEWWWTFVVISL
jgi:hypothetical protein